MALSMGLIAVVTFVLVGMYGGVSFSPGGPSDGQVVTADVAGGLEKAPPLVGFPVVIPSDLPADWTPNSFSFTEKPGSPAQPPAARAGWLTDAGRFITLIQSSGTATDVLIAEIGAAGPPKGTAFGIAAVTQALKGLDFPATKQDLLNHVRNNTIEYRKGQPVNLRKIIQDTSVDDFPSMANVVEAVSAAMEKEGLSTREKEKV